MTQIEEVTIKLSNRQKLNQAREDNGLPTNTNVKIDLQSNNDHVKIF